MKYGAVKVQTHAPRNPIAAANPKVYERSRWEGTSPPESHANGQIAPCQCQL